MSKKVSGWNRRRALLFVLLAAAILLLCVALRGCGKGKADLRTLEGRQQYLLDLGWEIEPESEVQKRVQIPKALEGVMADYNAMQQEQGFDLSKHLGEQCDQYTYRVTNCTETSDEVYVTLYLQGRKVIAGDIHSNALDGFMHGIYPE